MMQACLGFASFYCLQKSIRLQQLKYAATGGLLARLCALFHLNGLVFAMAGGLLLLVNGQIKTPFLFGSLTGCTSLLYFYDICCLEENFHLFMYQLSNNLAP